MRKFGFLLAMAAGLVLQTSPGWAARLFPPNSIYTKFQLKADRLAVLGGGLLSSGKEVKLSVGATIRDENNRIVLPNTVTGKDACMARVAFDVNGDIQRVWLLTPDEVTTEDREK